MLNHVSMCAGQTKNLHSFLQKLFILTFGMSLENVRHPLIWNKS